MKCDYCGEEIGGGKYTFETGGNKRIKSKTLPLPFTCSGCWGTFCAKHRLPESHKCPKIPKRKVRKSNIPSKTMHLTADIIDNSRAEKIKPDKNKQRMSTYIYLVIIILIAYFVYIVVSA